MSLDRERAYLTRVQHLIDTHSQTEFWVGDSKEGATVLSQIAVLLAGISCQADLIKSLMETCNPYNYSLLRTLQAASADSTKGSKVGQEDIQFNIVVV